MKRQLTFKTWKKAIETDVWFTTSPPYLQAVRIVHNAYVSRRMGQLSARGLKSAVAWAYNVNHNGAFFEEQRNEMKKLSTVV